MRVSLILSLLGLIISSAHAAPLASVSATAQPAPVPGERIIANSPAHDSVSLIATYDRGFRALTTGDLRTAVASFKIVAAKSVEPQRRAAALELLRLANRQLDLQLRPQSHVDQSLAADQLDAGRTEFIVTSTIASGLGGLAVSDALEVEKARYQLLSIAAAAGIGFTASILGTRNRRVTQGTADTWTLGLAVGAGNAFLLAEPIGYSDSKQRTPFAFAATAISGAGSIFLAEYLRPTPGQVMFTGTIGFMGLATVGLGLVAVQPEDIKREHVLLALAAGLNTGTAIGGGLSRGLDWSNARARLVSLGTALGTLGGASSFMLIGGEPNGDRQLRAFSGMTVLGGWTGLALTAYLTRGMRGDPQFDDGADLLTIAPARIANRPGISVMGSF